MKSLDERQKEKEEREKKERAKRSKGQKRYMHYNLPLYGYPFIDTDGDLNFLKKKAQDFISKCRTLAPWQFYDFLKEAIEIENKKEEELRKRRGETLVDGWRNLGSRITNHVIPITPVTPPTPATNTACAHSAACNFGRHINHNFFVWN